MQKYEEYRIDLNLKDDFSLTPFHLAHINNHSNVEKLIMQKSDELDIYLDTRKEAYDIPFSYACHLGSKDDVKML